MSSTPLALAAVLALSACTTYSPASVERTDVPMRDATGRDLGTLTLSNTTGGLLLSGTLSGLPPGVHGIHLHTTGSCEPPFTSAGGHWNPTSRQHGTLNPQGPHLGDMPNVTVSSDGSATVSVMTPGGTLRGANAVMDADGAAVVIHARADDYRTDPSGNSGERIACGVIGSR
jgi:Cu-Zn family superoxide dismutase